MGIVLRVNCSWENISAVDTWQSGTTMRYQRSGSSIGVENFTNTLGPSGVGADKNGHIGAQLERPMPATAVVTTFRSQRWLSATQSGGSIGAPTTEPGPGGYALVQRNMSTQCPALQ